jgi:hypothetical protein
MPESIESDSRLLALINKYDNADKLAGLLDPLRKNPLVKVAVEMIPASKKINNNPFSTTGQIRHLFPDETLFDQIKKDNEDSTCTTHPVILLPVRIETRFINIKSTLFALLDKLPEDHDFLDDNSKLMKDFDTAFKDGFAFKISPEDLNDE